MLKASIESVQAGKIPPLKGFEISQLSFCDMFHLAYDFSELTMQHVLTQSSEFERMRMVMCSREIGEMLRTKYDMDPMQAGAAMLVGGMEFIKQVHDEQHPSEDTE